MYVTKNKCICTYYGSLNSSVCKGKPSSKKRCMLDTKNNVCNKK